MAARACANRKCPYIAQLSSDYCCGTCANAAVVGDGGYNLHAEGYCARVKVAPSSYGAIEYGPSVRGPSTMAGCLAIVAVLIIVVVLVFVGAAIFGRVTF